MNAFSIYRNISRQAKLSEKRNPMFETNRAMKVFTYVMGAVFATYMIIFGVAMAIIANSAQRLTPYEFMFAFAPFILIIDFFLRFAGIQTPSQQLKPYILLPISKYTVVNCFIVKTLLSGFNLIWAFMLVPFVWLAVLFSEGWLAAVGFLFGWWVLMLINSQWYVIVRTLVNEHVGWWVLPILIYVLLVSPLLIDATHNINPYMRFWGETLGAFTLWSPFILLVSFALLTLLVFINRRLQYHFIYNELSRAEKVKDYKARDYKFLNKYGEVGEYLKLEIKSIMRNKTMRSRFLQSVLIVVIFSGVLSFTNIYDDSSFMTTFIAMYNMAIFGAMFLPTIMGPEGNYIDGLMVHKQNILSLLKAKYLFFTILLILPFLLTLPTVFTGKIPFLMLLSDMLLTSGPIYFVFFLLAIYNRQTIPLNSKLTGKANSNTGVQIIITFAAFFCPVFLYSLSSIFFSLSTTSVILLCIGLLFTCTYSLWLRSIYARMMLRRYENMEGFRATKG